MRVLALLRSALTVLLALAPASLRSANAAPDPDAIDAMKRLVRSRFPNVPQLSPADLAPLLSRTNPPPPLLLDARQPAEFEISHLPDARRIDPSTRAATLIPTLPTNRLVVIYCSVGYRSSELAARLLKAGFTNVANLEGSIFEWANQDRPLEAAGKPAHKVHPFSKKYAPLLKSEARAPIP